MNKIQDIEIKRKSKYQIFRDNENKTFRVLIQECDYENGLLLKESNYSDQKELISVVTYDYNGKLLAEKTIFQNIEVESKEVSRYCYDSENKLMNIVNYMNNDKMDEAKYRYNENGNLIEKIEYDIAGIVRKREETDILKKLKIEYEYDHEEKVEVKIIKEMSDTWKVLNEIEIIHEGILEGKSETKNTYNSKDELINTKIYEDGNLVLNEDYFYNQDGIEIGSTGYDYNSKIETKIKRYLDDNSRVIKEEHFENEELDYYYEKNYTLTGEILTEKYYSLDRSGGFEEINEFVNEYEK